MDNNKSWTWNINGFKYLLVREKVISWLMSIVKPLSLFLDI